MTDEAVQEACKWLIEHAGREYGEVGIILTKHDGHVVKVERIDRERIEKKWRGCLP